MEGEENPFTRVNVPRFFLFVCFFPPEITFTEELHTCIMSHSIHSYFPHCACMCVLVCKGVIYADQTHVAQGALLNGGINKKASGASVGRREKWSNLLLS